EGSGTIAREEQRRAVWRPTGEQVVIGTDDCRSRSPANSVRDEHITLSRRLDGKVVREVPSVGRKHHPGWPTPVHGLQVSQLSTRGGHQANVCAAVPASK